MRKLEEYLGVKLFERNRARVAATGDGEKVLRLARGGGHVGLSAK